MEEDEEAFCEIFQDDHQYQLVLVHLSFVYLVWGGSPTLRKKRRAGLLHVIG